MFIHEYQAKALLLKASILIPEGKVVGSVVDSVVESIAKASSIIEQMPFSGFAVKAQIHGGGRGKAGGIRIVNSKEEALNSVKEILGKRIVTSQTGPAGSIVRKILIEEKIETDKEIYIAITIDRKNACPVVMASSEGGIDVERGRIFYEEIISSPGLFPFQKRRLAYSLGLGERANDLGMILDRLCRIFAEYDSTLLEINPLAIDKRGRIIALDAKMVFDDNGLFRQKEISGLRDPEVLNPLENEAFEESLSYVLMDGNIGCLVNGAGLAMSTIDLIDYYGGKASNFLDVGGGASSEKIEKAIRILLKDSRMKVLLINIFGGILRCDRFAEGLIKALSKEETRLPIVLRFKGTNFEQGKDMIRKAGIEVLWANSMEDAVKSSINYVYSDK